MSPEGSGGEHPRGLPVEIKIPKVRSTASLQDVQTPGLHEHEHGHGMSGLRRIRQQPSRTPSHPPSPTTPFTLPTRSTAPLASEDLTRFPYESLHSFSFAHQTEDTLHNRQAVLKRAVDFMQDRLGLSTDQLGVIAAQAKLTGDDEIESMMELLVNALGSSPVSLKRANTGPLTGPVDVEGNVFESAFSGTSLRRTFTDTSLVSLENRLVDTLAKPYKDDAHSFVHGHNNRWVPAAQAVFTTEATSPWTILAANDLACLIFGVTKGEVKKLSMLEFVQEGRREWLQGRLRVEKSSFKGGGITAQLLSKPSWRQKGVKERGVLLCGDVVPIQKRNGSTGAASLWVKEKGSGLIWVAEQISEDIATIALDEDANVLKANGAAAIWGQAIVSGRSVSELIPGLPLVDGYAVDMAAVEQEDGKYYGARSLEGGNVPVSVGIDPVTRVLKVSSFPHIAGIVVLSASTREVISANRVFSACLFGRSELKGMRIAGLLPQFEDVLEFLTEDEKVRLDDGIVVPEHSFRRARAIRDGKFLESPGMVALHRDGSEINVDIQMRIVQSSDLQMVYALWITYSRSMHSKPTPPEPSPGQAESPVETLAEKLEEAASQPISETIGPPKSTPRTDKKIEDFTILEDMGQGAYGQVKLARSGSGGKVVLKYVTKKKILVDTWTRDRRLGTVPLEIHVLDYLRRDGLRHENVVEMIDFFEDDVNYYIEMVPHGLTGMDLFDYIEVRTAMDEAECRNIFRQVVAALHHLHTKALVVHRDIKDENVILDGDAQVKLIDFGSAAYIRNGPFDVFVGTIDYAAPEVLQGQSYRGKEQDIWALGILLYTLVYKENPFYSIDEILDHELRIPWIMSEESIDLIKKMLDRDVDRRVTISQVKEHAWLEEEGEGLEMG